MQFDKTFILEELRKQGQSQHVQNAIQQLPDKIDHDQHAALLQKFGLDPGKLVASAIERGIGSQPNTKPAPTPPANSTS